MTTKNKNMSFKNKVIKFSLTFSFFALVPTIGCLNPIKTYAITKVTVEEQSTTENKNKTEKTNEIKTKRDLKQENNVNNDISKHNGVIQKTKADSQKIEEEIKNDKELREKIEKIKKGEDFEITVLNNGKEEKMNFSEYIFGVTASEIGFNKPIEAVISQAIAASSYAINKFGINKKYIIGNTFQTYIPKSERIRIYGEQTVEKVENELKNRNILKMVLISNETKKIIESLYDGSSNGHTRTNEDVWFAGNKAYHDKTFESVLSPEISMLNSIQDKINKKVKLKPEEEIFYNSYSKKLKSIHKKNKNDVLKIIKTKDSSATMPQDNSKIVKSVVKGLDEYIKEIEIFGVKVSGEFIRRNLKLPSACFDITEDKEDLTFSCLGCGHGVGMSQAGADAFAIQGKKYDEILKHYYKNTEIKNLKDIDLIYLIKL